LLVAVDSDFATGEAAGPRTNDSGQGGSVTELALRIRPGMRKAIPLRTWGEIGVELGI
jgi:hypothetical protein